MPIFSYTASSVQVTDSQGKSVQTVPRMKFFKGRDILSMSILIYSGHAEFFLFKSLLISPLVYARPIMQSLNTKDEIARKIELKITLGQNIHT